MTQLLGMSAHGTVVARSGDPNWPDSAPSGGSVNFVDIAELEDITPPPLTRKAIDTTTHNQDDDRYVVGIRRHGDLSFKMNFIPNIGSHDEFTGLLASWKQGLRDIYRITFPDGSTWIFSGFVTNFAPAAPVDEKLSASVSIRPTGGHAFA